MGSTGESDSFADSIARLCGEAATGGLAARAVCDGAITQKRRSLQWRQDDFRAQRVAAD